ncbi:unnamed protein product [Rotaria sordida]|uniref:Uncharacterized protein n=1 Tax=Rotaria sordida TaxID=392033 RepID=A0A815EY28_9BILA|nr:unnamed protein product [Rotaria sordida]CAF1316268.1 unnamed protein product [Rotaria sordida]CAF1465506.1 unnamed protein product [Rotaria sordida]
MVSQQDQLRDYFQDAQRLLFGQHTRHHLKQALSWHIILQQTASMHHDHQTTKPTTSKHTEKAAKKIDKTATTNNELNIFIILVLYKTYYNKKLFHFLFILTLK